MNSSNGKNDSDIDKIKEKLSKNREKILRDARKIESGLESLERVKKLKDNKT